MKIEQSTAGIPSNISEDHKKQLDNDTRISEIDGVDVGSLEGGLKEAAGLYAEKEGLENENEELKNKDFDEAIMENNRMDREKLEQDKKTQEKTDTQKVDEARDQINKVSATKEGKSTENETQKELPAKDITERINTITDRNLIEGGALKELLDNNGEIAKIFDKDYTISRDDIKNGFDMKEFIKNNPLDKVKNKIKDAIYKAHYEKDENDTLKALLGGVGIPSVTGIGMVALDYFGVTITAAAAPPIAAALFGAPVVFGLWKLWKKRKNRKWDEKNRRALEAL